MRNLEGWSESSWASQSNEIGRMQPRSFIARPFPFFGWINWDLKAQTELFRYACSSYILKDARCKSRRPICLMWALSLLNCASNSQNTSFLNRQTCSYLICYLCFQSEWRTSSVCLLRNQRPRRESLLYFDGRQSHIAPREKWSLTKMKGPRLTKSCTMRWNRRCHLKFVGRLNRLRIACSHTWACW